MQFGVQHVVRNLTHLQHLAQHLRDFHRSRTDQHGTSGLDEHLDFLDDGFIFLTLCLIHAVVHVLACNRTVGRNLHHVEFIDVPKLAGLGYGRTGHTRQLMIHAEIVLQGNRGKSLGCSLHFNVLLGFHSLMQAVAPTTPVHDTSRLLVHNLHFAVDDDIFIVAVEHGISFQQLLQGVHTFALHGIVGIELVFFHDAFLVGQRTICLQRRHGRRNIRHNKQFRV